ncbi:MAG TPA: amidohydrolase family protein [Tepidisphaeraceae bacterium]|nr:amidohydrolase family protein [Tepidisphaeraceae bacterium]
MKKLILAEWVAPMDGPMIRGGGIAVEGERIVEVGEAKRLKSEHRSTRVEDFGASVILPGLVNAHTHLELSHLQREPAPSGGLAAWLVRVIKQNTFVAGEVEKVVAKAVAKGVKQCLQFGVSTVGDISRSCRLTRSILSRSPLRVVSYGEIQAMGQRRTLLEERLAVAADMNDAAPNVRIGITPHAPYSVEPQGHRRALQVAREKNLPLATHLAESSDEGEFLAHHRGALMKVWDFVGGFDDAVPTFAGGPIRLAKAMGLLDYPTLLAHVNYCDDGEMGILAAGKASVVYNPRTHAYFSHPPHRWREMLARGINVAIGTDSTASSGDLNLLEELRLLRRIAPEQPVQTIWEMGTIRAARAIQLEADVGSLTDGKLADMAIFPAHGTNPLESILDGQIALSALLIGGSRA